MRTNDCIDYFLGRLSSELDPRLFYHGVAHTQDDVLVHARETSHLLAPGQRVILETAAAIHDSGFLYGYHDHEAHSIGLARVFLPQFGYASRDINEICELIAATALPQQPTTLAAKLLCDADLDSLRREDFFSKSMQLFTERKAFGYTFSFSDWLAYQEELVRDHSYFVDDTVKRWGQRENYKLLQQFRNAPAIARPEVERRWTEAVQNYESRKAPAEHEALRRAS